MNIEQQRNVNYRKSHPMTGKGLIPVGFFFEWVNWLVRSDELYEDMVFCDFGGNNGALAAAFREKTCVPMTVIDGMPEYIEEAKERGVPTILADLENMPLADASVDWGFCSHTLEHLEDMDKGLSEISRVTRRGMCFVIPLETKEEFDDNPAHNFYNPDEDWWLDKYRAYGFHVMISKVYTHKDGCKEMFAICQKLTGASA